MRVLTEEADVVELSAVMARDNQFAKFNQIGLDPDGNPDPEDLHLAWARRPEEANRLRFGLVPCSARLVAWSC